MVASVVAASFAGAVPLGAATALPGAPTITSVTPGPRSITVAFTKPAVLPPGSFLYHGECRSSDGGALGAQASGASPMKMLSLSAGHIYTCRVRVTPSTGSQGPWSPESEKVTPKPEQKTHVPDPVPVVYVHPGKALVSVGFKRLDHSGGLKVTRYLARCVSSDGGKSNKQQRAISPIVVDHLTAGKTYTCRVAARNSLGFGAYGPASKPVKTTA